MAAVTQMKATPVALPEIDAILSLNNIEVVYDRVILVLKGVSLAVPNGGIVALLGANGAGKTTTLKAISNLLHSERGEVTKGAIVFDGAEVQDLSPNEVVRRGCIQVMQGRFCFGHLTIEENLLTGAFTRRDGSAANGSLRLASSCSIRRLSVGSSVNSLPPTSKRSAAIVSSNARFQAVSPVIDFS